MEPDAAICNRILVADDGELDDVRSALRELGFAVARPGDEPAAGASVRISSARCALAEVHRETPRARFHVVVTERRSAVLRRELGRIRPDFVLERPIDPTVLRFLMQHALHTGPERRRRPRVPLRAAVRVRVGRTTRSATLVDISEGGCRVEAKASFERGQRLTVVLPAELAGARPLELDARIVGAVRGSSPGLASLAFLPPDAAARSALRSLVAAAVESAGALRPREPERASAAPPPSRGSTAGPPRVERGGPPARRRSPRGSYRRRILASGDGNTHVLVGRDLSAGGMRVDRDPLLAVGRELKLVIHGTAGAPPAVVKAIVARDEGADGCVLQFRALSAAARARLEAIVRELPGARPADAGPRGPNVVVSEVVELGR